MTNQELEDALAIMEFVSSVLTLQLLIRSRTDSEEEMLTEDNAEKEITATRSLEERLAAVELRLSRLERRLKTR